MSQWKAITTANQKRILSLQKFNIFDYNFFRECHEKFEIRKCVNLCFVVFFSKEQEEIDKRMQTLRDKLMQKKGKNCSLLKKGSKDESDFSDLSYATFWHVQD